MQTEENYINLARKYRPQIILDLVGQDVLVKTLDTAFKINKIAHAFMLTGVRGVGKTTTARIIAKALNCIGADGKGAITLNPCGVCENCVAITEDRHMDVLEIDAASKTGIDDIRVIIDNSQYKPVMARYKVFIIDEVHMLSKNAFNALLKTLEEPPGHVKFIFATTEIRKVPITILSRCQRFDLKRITIDELSSHLKNICNKENIPYEDEAIFLITKVAGGSARDALSLLDQAIVFCTGKLETVKIQEMLGQGNKEEIYDILLNVVTKNTKEAMDIFYKQYNKGIEVENLLESLLEACHNISCVKILKQYTFLEFSDSEKKRVTEIANLVEIPTLIKLWQIMLKGVEEVKNSSNKEQMFRMVLVKMLFVSDLSDVAKIIDLLNSQKKNPVDSIAQKNSVIQESNMLNNNTTNNATKLTENMPAKVVEERPVQGLSEEEIIKKVQAILPKSNYLGIVDE